MKTWCRRVRYWRNFCPKVLFKIRISVRGTIKGIRGNLEEWNILQCTWGLFHISKMCEGSHLMVREWGVNLQLPCQRRSGPQSSISRFPEVIIQVAFHDRFTWIVTMIRQSTTTPFHPRAWWRIFGWGLSEYWHCLRIEAKIFVRDCLKSVVNHLNEEFLIF